MASTGDLLALRMDLRALPFFLVMGWQAERRANFRLSRADLAAMLGLGLFGYYLASYLDFLGLRYISAALERLILFVYPTLVILLSPLFLRQTGDAGPLAALCLCFMRASPGGGA